MASNAVVPFREPAVPALSMGDIERVAEAIAKGGLFGSRDPYAVLTLCLLAQAEGQHPAVVFRDYHIISGKPAKKADAMLRDFLTGGGKVEWHQLDDDRADATFSHPAGGSARISWDKKRVEQAQLGGNAMHKKYPRQMLRSRVISEGVRTVFPGATSGLYVPEEAATFAEEDRTGTDEPQRNGPAPRTKLEGPHSSKSALKKAITDITNKVRSAASVDDVNAALKGTRPTMEQAERDWPELLHGDPNLDEDEGLMGLVARRRTELSQPVDEGFKALLAGLAECETATKLEEYFTFNEGYVEALEDEQRREFDAAYEARDSAIALMGAHQ